MTLQTDCYVASPRVYHAEPNCRWPSWAHLSDREELVAWTGLVSSDLRGIYAIPAAPVIISHDQGRAYLRTSIKLETGVQDGSLDLTGLDGTVDLMILPLRSPLHGRSQVRRSKRRSPSSRRSPGQLSGRFRGEEARCSVLRMTETAKSGARHGVTWEAAAGPLATDHHWPGFVTSAPGTP